MEKFNSYIDKLFIRLKLEFIDESHAKQNPEKVFLNAFSKLGKNENTKHENIKPQNMKILNHKKKLPPTIKIEIFL